MRLPVDRTLLLSRDTGVSLGGLGWAVLMQGSTHLYWEHPTTHAALRGGLGTVLSRGVGPRGSGQWVLGLLLLCGGRVGLVSVVGVVCLGWGGR